MKGRLLGLSSVLFLAACKQLSATSEPKGFLGSVAARGGKDRLLVSFL